MKSILKILFVTLFISFLVAITGVFLPNEQKIDKSQEINVSPIIVYEQISNFKNWEAWFPELLNDSSLKINFGDITAGKGASTEFVSDKKGSTNLLITQSISPENIAVNFDNGTENKVNMLWYIDSTQTGCVLNWTLYLKQLNYFEKYFAFFNKSKLLSMISEGLENLNNLCTELKYSRTGDIEIVDLVAQPSVIIIDSVKPKDLQVRLQKHDAQLQRFFERREMKPTGKSFQLFYEQTVDTLYKFALGYPMEQRTWVWSTMKYRTLPEGKAAVLSHFGRIRNASKGYKKLKAFFEENNYELNGEPWEIYQFNKEVDVDTSLWETKIYFPIKQDSN